MAIISKCNLKEFTSYTNQVEKDMVETESYKRDEAGYKTVLNSLKTALQFAQFSEYEYYVAKEGDKAVGVLLMQKEKDRYLINDLVSIARGVGPSLAQHAISVARTAFPKSDVVLTSETENSTAFWLKHGFLSNDPSKTRSIGMRLPPENQ